MKKKAPFVLLIVPLFLYGGTDHNRMPNGVNERAVLTDLSIADTRVIEGNAGQKAVEVMVAISQVATGPVTVAYRTKDGSAVAGSDYVAATGSVSFSPGDLVKRITIKVNGDVAVEADETFEVVLSNSSGATLADEIGSVAIVNDDFGASGLSVYEVRLTFTGYTSFSGTPSDCPIRANGKVVLNGLLAGLEKVAPDDDITYDGTLQMDMDIDICSAAGEGDNAKQCGITVVGSGPMKTELKILFDSRGAYVLTKNESRKFLKSVSGSCDRVQIDEERTMVPDKTIASVFNGTELGMLTYRTLRVGRYVETGDGGETVVEVLRKIR